ncbi:MAG: 30S ribosomal protein S3 [Chloroflexota bacterium]|nr:30S ribosomal protein S3 [Chloroflexota bacterium]
MGHKVHPIGFRLGVNKTWQSKWYADRQYTELLHEDLRIRELILSRFPDAGIPRVEIDRQANQVGVTIHTAKPGIVIGRSGQKVDELRDHLEKLTGKRVRVNIAEVRQPELDAYLVARSIADQIERRVSYKRAIKQAVARSMQRGAQGIRIIVSGRLGGAEMSRREREHAGQVPLQTIRADIDFAVAEAHTTFGVIGVKVWIYRGDVIGPRQQRAEAERRAAAASERRMVREEEEPALEPAIEPAAPNSEGDTAPPSVAALDPIAERERQLAERERLLAERERALAEAQARMAAASGDLAPPAPPEDRAEKTEK